jgi:hypothetical protein
MKINSHIKKLGFLAISFSALGFQSCSGGNDSGDSTPAM